MKSFKVINVIIASIILAGCTSVPITLNYSPSSTMSVNGSLEVDSFKYLPSENNSIIKSNQIRNTGMGDVILDKNVNEYFEAALLVESRFVGIKINQSPNKVSGEITEFLIDDLGYSIDWTLEVKYIITQQSGNECYNKTHKIEKKSDKFVNAFATLNEV